MYIRFPLFSLRHLRYDASTLPEMNVQLHSYRKWYAIKV